MQIRVGVVCGAFGMLAAFSLGLVGCTAPGDGVEIVPVASNELGITHVEIDLRLQGDERVLAIRGLDEDEHEIGHISLRTGMVLYSPEPELMREEWHPGTELDVAAGEEHIAYVTPDRQAHYEGEPMQPELASFVRIAEVAAAVDREAGIRFAPATEEPYWASPRACFGDKFPVAMGDPEQCCHDFSYSDPGQLDAGGRPGKIVDASWHRIATGANLNKIGYRNYATACRDSSGNVGCTGTGCLWGPCGARVVSTISSPNSTGTVFHPTSSSVGCGYDSNGSAAGGTVSPIYPENFSTQVTAAPVTAACGATDCLADGSPVTLLTVIVDTDANSAGLVSSAAAGVSCAKSWGGTVTCTYLLPPNTEITLDGHPDAHTFSWGGDCNGSAQTCVLPMIGATTVTATYTCPPGNICQR